MSNKFLAILLMIFIFLSASSVLAGDNKLFKYKCDDGKIFTIEFIQENNESRPSKARLIFSKSKAPQILEDQQGASGASYANGKYWFSDHHGEVYLTDLTKKVKGNSSNEIPCHEINSKPSGGDTSSGNNTVMNEEVIAYVYVVRETCGWPLTEEQRRSLNAYKAAKEAVNLQVAIDFNSRIGEQRNRIRALGGTLEFCNKAAERKQYDKRAAQIWPKGTLAAPAPVVDSLKVVRPRSGYLPEEPSWSDTIESTFNLSTVKSVVVSYGPPKDKRDIELRPDVQANRLLFYSVWAASSNDNINLHATWNFFTSLYSCSNGIKGYDYSLGEFRNNAAAEEIRNATRDKFLKSWLPRSNSIKVTFRYPIAAWSRDLPGFSLKQDSLTSPRGSVGESYIQDGGSAYFSYGGTNILNPNCAHSSGPFDFHGATCIERTDYSTMNVRIFIDGAKLVTYCRVPGEDRYIINRVTKPVYGVDVSGMGSNQFDIGYEFKIPPIDFPATEEHAKDILARSPSREVDVTFTLVPGATITKTGGNSSSVGLFWYKKAKVEQIEIREINGNMLRSYTPREIDDYAAQGQGTDNRNQANTGAKSKTPVSDFFKKLLKTDAK